MDMDNLTEKEFSKLKRRDLLEMLLSQIQEDERLESKVAVMTVRINKQERSLTHLKERLDEKDEQIERLKERLNEKDALIEKLKERLNEKDKVIAALQENLEQERTSREIGLTESGSIAEAALKLSGIFEAAQDAANRYLENIKNSRMSGDYITESSWQRGETDGKD